MRATASSTLNPAMSFGEGLADDDCVKFMTVRIVCVIGWFSVSEWLSTSGFLHCFTNLLHLVASMRPCILIVEDDPITRELLRDTFMSAGIDSIMAEDGASMWKQMGYQPQAIILDLCLPDTDGLELLRQLRRNSDVPVLIHSTRSDEIERILGIEIGADDFLPKPCNLRELLARIRALLRRAGAQPGDRAQRIGEKLKFGGRWTLESSARRLVDAEGQTVELNGSAYSLLMTFLDHPQTPLSREQLSRALRRAYYPYDRSVDVHVSQLRKILGKQACGGEFIKTLRSQGYLFAALVETVGADN